MKNPLKRNRKPVANPDARCLGCDGPFNPDDLDMWICPCGDAHFLRNENGAFVSRAVLGLDGRSEAEAAFDKCPWSDQGTMAPREAFVRGWNAAKKSQQSATG